MKFEEEGKDEEEPVIGEVASLQIVNQNARSKVGGQNAKNSATRRKFLHAFELSFGNVSTACEYSQISRMTYYRWMASSSRVNRRFQKRIAAIKPVERQVDFLEAKLMDRVKANDTIAIIFGLKARGQHRGWIDKPMPDTSGQAEDLNCITAAVAAFLADHPEASRELVVQKFAEGRNVQPEAIQERLNQVA